MPKLFEFIPIDCTPRAMRESLRIDAIRWSYRKIPRSHSGHTIGHYSPGANHPLIPFESALELRAIKFLLGHPDVSFVLAQPFTIDYRWHGRRRHYTPDLLVAAQPVTPLLARQGFSTLSVIEIKRDIDPAARAMVDFKLQVVSIATGMPALLGIPVLKGAGECQEDRHAP